LGTKRRRCALVEPPIEAILGIEGPNRCKHLGSDFESGGTVEAPTGGDSGRDGPRPSRSQTGSGFPDDGDIVELWGPAALGDLQVLERLAAEQGDEVLDAVWAMIDVVRQIAGRLETAETQAARIGDMRAAGIAYRDIIATAERPLIMQIATMDLEAIAAAGTRLRRIGARELRDEGMTIDQIAKEFGVSRQRVSRLLRADPDTPGPSWLRAPAD
jgi:hypothetical protein